MSIDKNRTGQPFGRFWLVYPSWILLCVLLFAALRGAADPALPPGRITEREAIDRASAELGKHAEFLAHEPLHAAYSPRGELGDPARWVILFDAPGGTRLEQAIVVEVTGDEGGLIRIRRAVAE